jgi:hypothetical protein
MNAGYRPELLPGVYTDSSHEDLISFYTGPKFGLTP